MSRALNGIRVLDLSTPLAEAAGRLLADLGAEVIKIEAPGGCAARFIPPFAPNASPAPNTPAQSGAGAAGHSSPAADPEASLYWRIWGRGKRSVILDIEVTSDHARLLDLVDGADILIESSTPGEMDAKGLGYDALQKLNPALLYVSVTPFGQSGPHAKHPATDLTLSAAVGSSWTKPIASVYLRMAES